MGESEFPVPHHFVPDLLPIVLGRSSVQLPHNLHTLFLYWFKSAFRHST